MHQLGKTLHMQSLGRSAFSKLACSCATALFKKGGTRSSHSPPGGPDRCILVVVLKAALWWARVILVNAERCKCAIQCLPGCSCGMTWAASAIVRHGCRRAHAAGEGPRVHRQVAKAPSMRGHSPTASINKDCRVAGTHRARKSRGVMHVVKHACMALVS